MGHDYRFGERLNAVYWGRKSPVIFFVFILTIIAFSECVALLLVQIFSPLPHGFLKEILALGSIPFVMLLAPFMHFLVLRPLLAEISSRQSAEESLRKSRKEWEDTFNSIPDMITIHGLDMNIYRANRAAIQILGLDENLVLTTGNFGCGYKHFHATDTHPDCCPLRQTMETGKPSSNDFFEPHLDKFIEVRTSPQIDESGQITGFIHIVRDIGERKKTEEALCHSEELFRGTFEQAAVGICNVYPDGRIYSVNQWMCNMLGYTREELVKFSIYDITHPDDVPKTLSQVKQAIDGSISVYALQKQYIRKDGSCFWVSVSASLKYKPTGEPDYFIGIIQDISQRKEAEEKLLLSTDRLKILYQLSMMTDQPEVEIKDFALEAARSVTKSSIGYIFFMDDDETTLTLHARSIDGKNTCTVPVQPTVRKLTETGLWGEAARQRKPVITNDYLASNPFKKGCPDGHIPITRHMNVPIIDNGRIILIAGVGNKLQEYDETDVQQLTLVMDSMWRIIRKKRAEEALLRSETFLREAQEMANLGWYTYDIQQGIWDSSQVLDNIFGIDTDYLRTVEHWGKLIAPDLRPEMTDYLAQVIRTGERFKKDYRIIRPRNGEVRWVSGIGEVEYDANGTPLKLIGTIQDITERKLNEELARKQEDIFHNLFNNTEIAMFRSRLDGSEVLNANEKFLALVGRKREEVIGKPSVALWADPDSRTEMVRLLQADHRVVEFEVKILNKENAVRECITSLNLYPEEEILEGSIQDITERKRHEKILHNIALGVSMATGEEFFTSLVSSLATGLNVEYALIGTLDPENTLQLKTLARFANGMIIENTTCELHGTPCDRVSGRALDIYARNVQALFPNATNLVDMGAESYAGIVLHNSAGDDLGHLAILSRRPLDNTELVADMLQIFAIRAAAEIERQYAEKTLRENEHFLSTIIESEPECVKLLAEDGSLMMMNRSGLDMLEAESMDQIKGCPAYSLVVAEYQEQFNALIRDVFQGKSGNLTFEIVGLKGRRLWLDTHAVPLRNAQGEIIFLLSISRDITAQLKSVAAQKESEERFRQIFSQNDDALFLLAMGTHEIIDANPSALALFNLTREDLAKERQWLHIIDQDNFEEFIRLIPVSDYSQSFQLDKAVGYKKDGTRVSISMRGKILTLGGDNIIYCSIRDITEKLSLENEIHATQAKLIHANKMTSLGMLTSSIAHEVNNPNNYISLNAKMLACIWQEAIQVLRKTNDETRTLSLMKLPFEKVEEMTPKLFNAIIEGSARITTIVNNMKNYVRSGSNGLDGIIEVNCLVHDSVELLWHHINKHTDNFRTSFQDDIPTFKGNPQQIEQVIINLIVNALEALPNKTSGVFITTAWDCESGCVSIQVQDEGEGMDQSILDRISEPFFSTKQKKGGTGLGLYISETIIKDHNGKLNFESESGRGTTATILLPLAELLHESGKGNG
jgi:PAS domain S-box-containing protein